MLTLAVIFTLELYLWVDLGLTGVVEIMPVVIILLVLGWTSTIDAKGGYLCRLGLLLALVWYMGSLVRWLPIMDAMYAGGVTGEILGMAVLLVGPLAMVLGPIYPSVRRMLL